MSHDQLNPDDKPVSGLFQWLVFSKISGLFSPSVETEMGEVDQQMQLHSRLCTFFRAVASERGCDSSGRLCPSERGHSSRPSGFCAPMKGNSLDVSPFPHRLIMLKPLPLPGFSREFAVAQTFTLKWFHSCFGHSPLLEWKP